MKTICKKILWLLLVVPCEIYLTVRTVKFSIELHKENGATLRNLLYNYPTNRWHMNNEIVKEVKNWANSHFPEIEMK